MSLADLANLGEAIGGVAVLVTLIYLAFQMRQSADLAQGVAQRDLMNSFQDNLDRVARDPILWQRGVTDFEALSNEDKLLFQLAFNPFINHLEQTLRMRGRGLESQDNVDVYGNICLSLVLEPGVRQLWEQMKPLYFPLSREYIEQRLNDGADSAPRASEVMPWTVPDEPAD